VHSPNHKGAVAEAMIAAHAIKLGIDVLKPATEHGRYDIAFDLGNRFVRVQCKWGSLANEVIRANLGSSTASPRGGYVRRSYSPGEIDCFAIYCGELDSCYLLPADGFAGRFLVHLRVGPPRNSQRAALNWASSYELTAGAVAQLGERRDGIAEARGSSPLSSTPAAEESTTVGAHRFRNHFGFYMERAEAGEEILVTRHGRPTVRLLAA
jgi:prevent-host-death family protein